jgi:uncharacterized membrane protein
VGNCPNFSRICMYNKPTNALFLYLCICIICLTQLKKIHYLVQGYMFLLQEVIIRPEVETCSLAQDNVFSLVVLDGLHKYTYSLLHNGMDSIKLFL